MSRDIDINVLIAVRGGSKRVPRKNIRPFGGSNLLKLKVEQALRLRDVNKVVVTSDDDEMLQIAEDLGAHPSGRDLSIAAQFLWVMYILHLASSLNCKDILWTQ